MAGPFSELPVKSHFRQVHLASRFGELNLVKTPAPFLGNLST
jgi:hypothetical protein